jgi:sorting nexin-8
MHRDNASHDAPTNVSLQPMLSSLNSEGELGSARRKMSFLSLTVRRRALRRFINMIVNHPVMKDDGALNVFLTHTDFEAWRKRTKVSTEEESASKQLNPAQEMAIPADLEEKLGVLRDHLPSMLASYQKLVILAERSLGRLQAAAADVAEEMPTCCYRNTPGGGACSLCSGVARGFGEVGESWTRVAEEGEKRVSVLPAIVELKSQAGVILLNSIEALKTQRDLYLAFRDLFARHDREWVSPGFAHNR